MPGARLIDKIILEVKGDFRSGGVDWSFGLTIPPMQVIENLRRAVLDGQKGVGDDEFLPQIEALICPYLDDPEGFEESTTWADVKNINETWYYQLMGEATGQAIQAALGDRIEIARKNS